MARRITQEKNSQAVSFRLPTSLMSKIQVCAEMYADGDISSWIRHCVANYNPRMLTKKKCPKAQTKTLPGKWLVERLCLMRRQISWRKHRFWMCLDKPEQ